MQWENNFMFVLTSIIFNTNITATGRTRPYYHYANTFPNNFKITSDRPTGTYGVSWVCDINENN